MPLICIQELSKEYSPGHRALDRLNLSVADGELMALVGPSGCGKSTLLRLLAGLERPTTGTISFDGQDVTSAPPKSRHIAMAFQQDNLFPHLNVGDNLAFGLKMRNVPWREVERTVRDVAHRLDLLKLLDRWPHALSGGERQRVALGRTFATQATTILLDEPLSNVDPAARESLRATIRTFQRDRRCTLLYVTHDQEEAMTLGDRIAVMASGRLQQVDTPTCIYREPANEFVASFIGSPEMNRVAGEIQAGRLHFCGTDHGAVAGVPDGPVRVGIRAEDLIWDGPGPYRLPVVLCDRMFCGRHWLGTADQGEQRWSVLLPAHDEIPVGSRGSIAYDLSAVHLFAASGPHARLSWQPA